MSRIDFEALAKAALSRAEWLLGQWLPGGHKLGGEWRCRNPLRADQHEGSFSVSLVNGAWGDFASDDKGGDLVELYTYLFHGGGRPSAKQRVTAARELADLLGVPDLVPPPPKGEAAPIAHRAGTAPPPPQDGDPARARRTSWVPVMPVPPAAEAAPLAHEFRGIPERKWTYLDATGQLLGHVCRFRSSDGGKEIIPLTYARNEKSGRYAWRWLQWDAPRPLYGLHRLAERPDATVLVVEGEKCADVAWEQLPDLAPIAWPGGGKAADKADWSPLAGRKVITWADCDAKRAKLTRAEADAGADPSAQPYLPAADQPGIKTMRQIREILAALDCRIWDVTLPAVGEVPDGWDIADAVEGGLVGTELAAWMRQRLVQCHPAPAPESLPPEPPEASPEPPPPSEKAAQAPKGKGGKIKSSNRPPPDWDDPDAWRYRLREDKDGNISGCLANIHDVLTHREEWAGVIAYDEFAQRTVKLQSAPYDAQNASAEWTGVDDTRTAIWLTHEERMTPTSANVAEAIEVLARLNPVHPVRDWLHSLPAWDGTERLEHWLCDFMAVEDSPYVRLVARFYVIAMVARVMDPGCKFDNCLVLEGSQGLRKSTALGVLGGQWYADTDLDLANKDSMSALQGVWLHEFAELGSLARSESTKQKSFLSRREDKYRPVYGRRDIRVPRQLVFAGTTNEWNWNKDATGGRRFWPVECRDELNIDGLTAARDQLFAEALAAFARGDRYWPSREEQALLFDPEQLKREAPDDLVDALHDWVYARASDFSAYIAATECLKLDASKLTRDMQTRIGIALRKLGCSRIEKRNGMTRYWYKPPVRNGATSHTGQPLASIELEGDDMDSGRRYRAPF